MLIKEKKATLVYGLAALVGLFTFIIYLPSLQNGFVEWDDNQYIFENPHIRSISPAFFKWTLSTFYAGNWHPLTWVSHALDYAAWGVNPVGHHLTNIVLHGFNTFLVVLLAVRLLTFAVGLPHVAAAPADRKTLIAAALAGLLFGIHPVHVESVAWVSERKDLLCALFFLLSVMAYTKYAAARPDVAEGRGHRWKPFSTFSGRSMIFSLFFFALAILSKPMAVSLPVVLLILDWYPFRRVSSPGTLFRACIEKTPFVALSLISAVLTVMAQKAGGAMALMDKVPLPTRLLVACKSLILYLLHMVLPANLLFFYPYPREVSLLSAEYLVPVFVFLGISAAVTTAKRKFWLAVWAYYIITLIPVLGIVQVGSQSMADRYTYLPSVGPFLLFSVIASEGIDRALSGGRKKTRLPRFFAEAAVVSVVVILCSATIRQIGVWKNSIVLWTSVINEIPDKAFFAFHNRGLALSRLGRYDEAIRDYQEAIALKPTYAETYSNLGIALLGKGFREEAIRNYRIAISLDPALADAHKNLAAALYMEGRMTEALHEYQIVASLRPNDAGAQADLGSAYGETGQYDKAIEHFQEALRMSPDLADAHYNLAIAYRMTGDMDKAREHMETALRLKPEGFGNTPAGPRR